MQTITLLQNTGRSSRAKDLLGFYEAPADLAGQSIDIDAQHTVSSTDEFCYRLLEMLLIEREAEKVHVRSARSALADRFDQAAVELGMSKRVEVDRRNPDQVCVTVNMTRTTVARVERLAQLHHDTKTDTINRAVALYDMLEELDENGGIWTQRGGDLVQLKMKH